MRHEHLQQGELRAGQLHRASGPADLPGGQVHGQVGEGEGVVVLGGGLHGRRVGAAAQQRADAGEQLVQLERLHQVVVRPRVQAGHPVADRVAGRQHQDGGQVTRAADAAGGGQAVHAGHLDVQDDQVGPVRRRLLQRVGAVDRDLGVVPLEGEAALEGFADRRLVVDDQDALDLAVAVAVGVCGAHGLGSSDAVGYGYGVSTPSASHVFAPAQLLVSCSRPPAARAGRP